jgi:hypothetical protein
MHHLDNEPPIDQIHTPAERIHAFGGMIVEAAARLAPHEVFMAAGRAAASVISRFAVIVVDSEKTVHDNNRHSQK